MESHMKVKFCIISFVLLWTVQGEKIEEELERWRDIKEVKELKDQDETATPPCMETDVYYYGNSLKTLSVLAAEACATLCSDEVGCAVWTWFGEYGVCILGRESPLQKMSMRGAISGKKGCGARTDEEAERACIDDANSYRKRHPGTPLFEYNAEVTEHAQAWANHIRDNNVPWNRAHSLQNLEGENIFFEKIHVFDTDRGLDKVAMCKRANHVWYSEISDWDFDSASKKLDARYRPTNHVTQMIWKASTSVGYGVVRITDGFLTVARYKPVGNINGQYAENVLPVGPGLLLDAPVEKEILDTGSKDESLERASTMREADEGKRYMAVLKDLFNQLE